MLKIHVNPTSYKFVVNAVQLNLTKTSQIKSKRKFQKISRSNIFTFNLHGCCKTLAQGVGLGFVATLSKVQMPPIGLRVILYNLILLNQLGTHDVNPGVKPTKTKSKI